MVTKSRPRVKRAITVIVACAALTTACSGSHDEKVVTRTVTATATISMAPSYNAQEPSQAPTQAPSQEPQPTPATVSVQPTVSIASVDPGGSITVGGFVIGVAEDGKQCLFVLTAKSGGERVTATTLGLANQGTTACGSATLTDSRLTRGAWNVTLSYTASGATVTSDPVLLEIP